MPPFAASCLSDILSENGFDSSCMQDATGAQQPLDSDEALKSLLQASSNGATPSPTPAPDQAGKSIRIYVKKPSVPASSNVSEYCTWLASFA